MNSPETLAIIAAYNVRAGIPSIASLLPYTVESGHVAIGMGGSIPMTVDLRTIAWETVYRNTTEDVPFFLQVSVSPDLAANDVRFCLASIYLDYDSPPSENVCQYFGTNIYTSLVLSLSRGLLTAWVPPTCYYKLSKAYTGNVDTVTRTWLAEYTDLPPLS
jgi:hypothetical protein